MSDEVRNEQPNGHDQQASGLATEAFRFSSDLSLEKIRQLQAKFARDRNWDQYHSPRNVLLALVGEVGELAEIFQWKGEVKEGLPGKSATVPRPPDFTEAERRHVGQEMGDVLLYLIRMADRCHIDLPSAAIDKIEQNQKKYPADKVYGKSNKYTDYINS